MVLHPSGQEARRRAGVVVGLIAVMAATMITGCSADNGDAATRDSPRPDLQVVTTVSPLTSIVANIAGPDVAVTGLVPEGVTMAQMALRWILAFPAVTCAIPGARRPAQVDENVAAADLAPLSDATLAAIDAIYANQVRPHVHHAW